MFPIPTKILLKSVSPISQRTFKNFGHKHEPIPGVTTLWHGFLTFTFIGMCLKWDQIKEWVAADDKIEELTKID